MKRIALVLSALVAFALAIPSDTAHACMAGVSHPQQRAFLFWHDGIEVLVWRSMVAARAPSPGETAAPRLPAQMGWVLAVPQTPLAYAIVDPEQFDSALGWADSLVRVDYDGIGHSGGGRGEGFGGPGLHVGETVHVGEYAITPITGTGARAGTSLRRWLRSNGFSPPSPAGTRFYIDHNWTFLAVKARLPRTATAATLSPLSIAFRSDDIVVPTHLTAGEAAFALDVSIFASKEIAMPATLRHGFRVENVGRPGYANRAESLPSVVLPHVNIAAATRNMIRPMIERVPELARLDRGALSFARITASPLSTVLAEDDVHIPLGNALPDPRPASP